MRAQGISWSAISEALGKKKTTCYMHRMKLQEVGAYRNWSSTYDEALKNAYQRKKGHMWNMLANEMEFQRI